MLQSIRVFCCCLFLSLLTVPLLAQSATSEAKKPVLEGIPAVEWQNPPQAWKVDAGELTISAGKNTNWFVNPQDGAVSNNTPRLLFKPTEDFVLSAKVEVGFHSTWDSGALVLFIDDQHWAKLCFEQTVEGHPAIVSVVTRDLSDDNNSIAISGKTAWLKVAKSGQAIFFYASVDGEHWSIIRAFSLGPHPDLRVGFSSQSPAGEGCTSVFSRIRYRSGRVDLWQER